MCVRRWLAASRTPLLTDRGRPPSRITGFRGAEQCFCEKFHFRVMFLWEFDVSPWGSCRFRATFARSCVFAWCFSANSTFPHGEVAGSGGRLGTRTPPGSGKQRDSCSGKKHAGPTLQFTSNLPHERGPPVDVHEETRSILQGAPQTWSHARDLGFFS